MMRKLLAPFLALWLALFPALAPAASLTPPNLTAAGSIANADLLLVWPTGSSGPLESITWTNFKTAMQTGLGGSFLQTSNNLSDVASPATSRSNLGLGTAAQANTGTAGAVLPFANGANTWAATQTFTLAPVFTDQSGSRTALGLGNSATRAVGQSTGQVAAGDDSRFGGPTQNSQSAAYGLLITDAGGQIYHPSADTTPRTWTIPANGSVAYAIGTKIELVNDCSAGAITLAITTDTMTLFPAGTTGTRSIAACGMATLTKVTATKWVITGVGVT